LNDPGRGIPGRSGSPTVEGVRTFAETAAAGGFAISPAAGQDMLHAIHRLRGTLEARARELRVLRQRPPLGASHAAEVVQPFAVEAATDGEGFLTRLEQLRQSLGTAEEGIKAAMANNRPANNRVAVPPHRRGNPAP
jgi:hypothetical protein